MKKKLPKFKGKPLTEEEHEKCTNRLAFLYIKMGRLIAGLNHVLSGRIQKYRNKDCPCVYVFYNAESFKDNQRGLMYIMQDLENGKGFEIVFREWKSMAPLSNHNWSKLRDDDRYKVCSYKVITKEDFTEAMKLIKQAKQKFEIIFEITV